MPVLRTFGCLNRKCSRQFDSWEANPACPACGCLRVGWVPKGGHVAGSREKVDAELRALADCFKLTDMNSAERGRGAKKVATPADVSRATPAQVVQFAPGFAAPVHPDRAVCVPSSNRVDFKARVGPGTRLERNHAMPELPSNTRIEASHKGTVAS